MRRLAPIRPARWTSQAPSESSPTWHGTNRQLRLHYCDGTKADANCKSSAAAATDFSIRLVMADDSLSKPVYLKDYISLTDGLNRFIKPQGCPETFEGVEEGAPCQAADIKDAQTCFSWRGLWVNDNKCLLNVARGFMSFLLFHEVPIELTDFGADLTAVKGIRFTFDRSAGTNILMDRTFAIRALSK